ncbi:MAG: hypothetical protein WCO84_03825 [bacterium]
MEKFVDNNLKEGNKEMQEKIPKFINFVYGKIERKSTISAEQEMAAKNAFFNAIFELEKEWQVDIPMKIRYLIWDSGAFRDVDENNPRSKKYCFAVRDHKNDFVYINPEIFSVFPKDAESIIKHETAHMVVEKLVGDLGVYRKSYFFEEGTAGLDGATARLISKIKKEGIKEIPNPLLFQSVLDIKNMGGDSNKESFTEQVAYLVLFSCVEFLRERHGEKKIIEIYKNIKESGSLENSYQQLCKESLNGAILEWNEFVKNKTQI